jgi:hypothetical protein
MPDEPDLPSVPPDLPSVPPHLPSAPPVVPSAAEPASQPATPPPTVREVLTAGCTRHDDQDRARGFAAGGELVQMDPGPVLARHAAGAITDGLGTLDDDELTGLLCAARRLSSWTASIEVRAVSQLDARRRAYAATAGDLRQAQLRPHRPTLRRRSHHPLRPGRAHVRMQSLPRLQVITTHLAILVAR